MRSINLMHREWRIAIKQNSLINKITDRVRPLVYLNQITQLGKLKKNKSTWRFLYVKHNQALIIVMVNVMIIKYYLML